ncbi:MAG TPA: hypothetical protein VLA43_05695, partial [Longimicrobiales bacterium]|nr:hypothetical protein [Longimicrobiales bacterium]
TDPGTASAATAPELAWPTMDLETTALEPWEARGTIRITWQDDLMAAYVQNEDAMPTYYLRDGDQYYTSQTLMGWTLHDRTSLEASSPRAYRYLTWDLPALATDASPDATDDGLALQAPTTFRGRTETTTLRVQHDGTTVTGATVETPFDPESPYTLHPATDALPFSARAPAGALPSATVEDKDEDARQGHARIIGWLDAYARQNAGRVPDQVTPQALAVQRLTQAWPTNPYAGTPMTNDHASGHFTWTRCSDTDAVYMGYGWDGSPIGASYGNGCAQ